MAEARSQHRLGIALVVAAAVFWSTAPFFNPDRRDRDQIGQPLT